MVLSGDPLLAKAALEAVKQWVYKPTLLNGEPVEVKTTIDVNFTLSTAGDDQTPARIHAGSGLQSPSLIYRVEPVFPPAAKQAGIHGQVVLQATVGKDGAVQDIEVISGDPILVKAAVDAFKKWRYRPPIFNGEPVESKTTITLTFVGK